MPTTIEALSLEVKQNSSDAVKGLDALTNSLTAIKNATKGGMGLKTVINSLNKVSEAVDSSKAESLTKLAKALSSLGEVKISSTIAKSVGNISDSVNRIDGAAVARLGEMTRYLQQLKSVGGINLTGLGKLTTKGKGSEAEKDPMAQVPKNSGTASTPTSKTVSETLRLQDVLKGLQARLNSVGSTIGSVFGKALPHVQKLGTALSRVGKAIPHGIFKLFKKQLQSVGSVTKKTTGMLGRLFNSLKRIAFYRAIRAFFSALSQAMKEGINNLYQYSALMGTTFKGSMDRLASSFLYLKNSMGAMVAPLINALAPAVEFLIDRFVTLLNVVNQFFAALTGAGTFTKATKQAVSYGDAIGSAGGAAGKAAKEIRDATIGIDELNIIHEDEDSGSGGGSGGGGGGGSYADMFEEATVDNAISDFATQVRQAFDNEAWEELGTLFGDKFNGLVDTIPWGEMGTKVGNGLDGIITTADTFIHTADFKDLGSGVSEFFNNAVGEVDWEHAGSLVTGGFTSVVDFLIGFVTTLNTEDLAGSVSDFFTGLFGSASDWLDSVDWEELGETLTTKVVGLVTGIKWGEVTTSFASLLGNALGAAVQLLGGVKNGVGDMLPTDIVGETPEDTASNIGGIFEWFHNLLTPDPDAMAHNIFTPFVKGALGDNFWEEYIAEQEAQGKEIAEPLKNMSSDDFWGVAESMYAEAIRQNGTMGLYTFPLNGASMPENDPLLTLLARTFGWYTGPGSTTHTGESGTEHGGGGGKITIPVELEMKDGDTVESFVAKHKGGNTNQVVRLKRLDKAEGSYKGWDTVFGWINNSYLGGLVTKGVGLVRDGWTTLLGFTNKYSGGNATKYVSLARPKDATSKWVTIEGWAYKFSGNTLVKAVNLTKKGSNWEGKSVTSWIQTNKGYYGGIVSKPVNLTRKGSNWEDKSVTAWIQNNKGYYGGILPKPVNLTRKGSNWADKSVSAWIVNNKGYYGGVVPKVVNLTRKGSNWESKSVASWIKDTNTYYGGNVAKTVNLTRADSNWNNLSVKSWIMNNKGYYGDDVTKAVQLTKPGNNTASYWSSVGDWISKQGSTNSTSVVSLKQNSGQWSGVGSWVQTTSFNANDYNSTASVSLAQNTSQWTGIGSWAQAVSGVDTEATATINVQAGWFDDTIGTISDLVKNGGTISFSKGAHGYAEGGVIQAAGGLVSHGSMFVAGEAGAELVGHIGGRTEVMNRFQIATMMRDSVLIGISAIAPMLTAFNHQSVENANAIIRATLAGANQMSTQYAASAMPTGAISQMVYDAAPARSDNDQDMMSTLRQWYETDVAPTLSRIASDTQRQADKSEQTVLQVDGRTLAKTVNTQNIRNGYSFAVG